MTVAQTSRELSVELLNPRPGRRPKAYPYLSQSIATTLANQSPLHAWGQHPLLGGMGGKSSAAMDFGSICHELLLHQESRMVEIEADDWRTKAARAERDEARKAGKIPVLVKEAERARVVTEILRGKLAALGVVFEGIAERRIQWVEKARSGRIVECEGTPDHVLVKGNYCFIDDLKTTRSSDPSKFKKSMVDFGYDIQWSAYTRGCEQVYDRPGRTMMRFIACETEWPFVVSVLAPDGTMRALGTQRWLNSVETWDQCVHQNTWPDYGGRSDVGAPLWAIHQAAEEMEHDD
ncbi:MAG: PD-(D/E)XK nuclease-like domain-containing protein [Gammaproteobacteria bacterium]|nr:PD-(D/E)XK nuclease-like domain-containing protein [Gammaproteobacteria bacterium]